MPMAHTKKKFPGKLTCKKNKEKLPTRKRTLKKECIKKIANTYQGMHIKTKTIHKKNKCTHNFQS